MLLVVSVVSGALLAAQTRPATAPLEIYVIDTEGGKATLFISPSGESLLIDSGNPGGRDTDRILTLFGQIGLKQIDHLISTHYHIDHIGGLAELARRIPIRHYLDHGPTVEEKEQLQGFQAGYAEIYTQAKHTVVHPGDRVPIAGLDWRIVSAGGKALKAPLAGGGRAEPGVRSVEAEGQHARSRERPVGRQRDHLRPVPRDRSRRPALGQRARSDVPRQSDRDSRSLPGVAPRPGFVRVGSARARPPPARGRDAERPAQRRRGRGDADHAIVARPRGHLAAALVVHGRRRAEQRRRVRRRTSTIRRPWPRR